MKKMSNYREDLIEEILYHKESDFYDESYMTSDELYEDYGTGSRKEAFDKFTESLKSLTLEDLESHWLPDFGYVRLGISRLEYEDGYMEDGTKVNYE
jgi:hypothetical protein